MSSQYTAEKWLTQVVLIELVSLGHFLSHVQYFVNILFHWTQLCGQRPKRILNCMLQLFPLELLPQNQCGCCSQNIIIGHLGPQLWKSVETVHQRWPQDVSEGLSCLCVDIWKKISGICLPCFNSLVCYPLNVPVNENTGIALAHAVPAIWVVFLHVYVSPYLAVCAHSACHIISKVAHRMVGTCVHHEWSVCFSRLLPTIFLGLLLPLLEICVKILLVSHKLLFTLQRNHGPPALAGRTVEICNLYR